LTLSVGQQPIRGQLKTIAEPDFGVPRFVFLNFATCKDLIFSFTLFFSFSFKTTFKSVRFQYLSIGTSIKTYNFRQQEMVLKQSDVKGQKRSEMIKNG
jgi:hypothetical protein